jgi:hypothetical protein
MRLYKDGVDAALGGVCVYLLGTVKMLVFEKRLTPRPAGSKLKDVDGTL